MKILPLILLISTLMIKGAAAASDDKAIDLPLKTTRQLSFTTAEGTWLSLDVTPDGQTLFFDLLGDIYSLDIKGGKAIPVLTGLAFEMQPSISPDGNKIAFVSDRSGNENIWIANIDGSNLKQLSKDTEDAEFTSPAWSPDGRFIYASRTALKLGISVFETWAYNVDGGTGLKITKAMPSGPIPHGQRYTTLGPTASADGKYLYYAAKTGAFEYNLSFPQWHINRYDLNTGAENTIITAAGSAMRPTLSPSGTYIVYATRQGKETILRIRNLATGADKFLVAVDRDDQEGNASRDLMPSFSFTPDGKDFIYSAGGNIKRISLSDDTISTIPFSVDVRLDIGPDLRKNYTENTSDVTARIIHNPSLSPDGKKVVFSALSRIYVIDIKTNEVHPITDKNTAASHASWAPDSDHIVYVSWSLEDGGHIWEISTGKQSAPRRLTKHSAFYSNPVITPDGTSIIALKSGVYDRTHAANELFNKRPTNLVKLQRNSSTETILLLAPGAKELHFTQQKNRLYFSQNGALKSINLDGKELKTHLKATADGSFYEGTQAVQSLKLSPDSQWALTLHNSRLYLLGMPPQGFETSIHLGTASLPIRLITDLGADYFEWAEDGTSIRWALGHTLFNQSLKSLLSDKPGVPKTHNVSVNVARDVPQGKLLLQGATVIPMQDSRVLEETDILISNNRIMAIGPKGTLTVPAGTDIKDMRGKFIIPGFVDTHAHWIEIRRDVTSRDNWSFLINLAYGVTSGLDVQAFDANMFVYKDMIDAGMMLGPRTYSTGRGFFSDNRIKDKKDSLTLLKRNRDYYKTHNVKSYVIGNRKQRQLMVIAAAELGMIPTTEGAIDTKLGLTHAIDGFSGNEHALTLTPLYNDVVQLYSQTRISYTPTLLATYGGPWAGNHFFANVLDTEDTKLNRFMPRHILNSLSKRKKWAHPDEHIYPDIAKQVAKIYRAGGLIGIGSHAEFQGLGYHWEMQALATGGLSAHETLQAATRMGSEIIGRSQDIGTLEPGKFADILILSKNPLSAIENTVSIEQILKNGRLYSGDTLDELWPNQRPLKQ